MKTKTLLMGSAFYSIGNMGGAGLNMLYQFVLMGFLSRNDYGIIQPLLQFIGLLVLPVSAYQYALTKHYGDISDKELDLESIYVARRLVFITLGVAILWIVLIPTLNQIFHIDDAVLLILLLVSLILQTIQAPFISRLQAEKRFFIAGSAQLAQGITRMSIGLLCVWKIPNVWGAMTGILFSNITLVLMNILPYRRQLFLYIPQNFKPQPISLKLLFVSLGSVGLFSLLMYSDTVLVRSLLPDFSGLFASSNLLGKGMIFLTAGVSFVILPMMAGKVSSPKKALWIGFTVLSILVICYVAFFAITGSFLGQIMFKNDTMISHEFAKYMTLYNLMFIPYPLIYYFLNYYLVKESIFYPILLAISNILLFVSIFKFHSNLTQIIYVIGVVGYLTLFIVLMHSIFSKDKGSIHEEQIDESSVENLI